MKFEYYNPGDVNCVIRSISKVLEKNYKEIKEDLIDLSKKLGFSSYSEIEVFENYLNNNKYVDSKIKYDGKIKDFKFDDSNIVFCYDKKDFYHLVAIIDNVMYDKKEDSKDLYVLKIYKRRK